MLASHHPRRHAASFSYAWQGITFVIRSQANFRIHLLTGLLTIVLAWVVGFDRFDWLILVGTITGVFILEMVNTIFEVLVDHLWQEEHPKAKIIKDVAAGVVLVGAIGAAVIGCLLFIPYLSP